MVCLLTGCGLFKVERYRWVGRSLLTRAVLRLPFVFYRRHFYSAAPLYRYTAVPLYAAQNYVVRMGDEPSFIDATRKGNISRFFNHSCNPNLYMRTVSTVHDLCLYVRRVVRYLWTFSAYVGSMTRIARHALVASWHRLD